jgi:hypothetical protein
MNRLRLAALLLLAACQRPQPESADPARSGEAAALLTPAATATLQRVSPFMRGVWVKTDYLAAIKRTRSPFAASSKLTDIVALSIDPRQAAGDSLVIGASLNNHEGASFSALLRQGLQLTSLPVTWPDYVQPTNFYELSYRITASDTAVLLNKYNPQKRLLQSVQFSRVPGVPFSETSPSDGLQYFVNRQLLAGTYTATDAKGNKKQVQFSPTGQVTGLDGFREYYLATDFAVTMENNLDNIIFDIGTKRQQDFVYTISQDTMRLYTAQVVEPDLVRGPLQYTLVRVR